MSNDTLIRADELFARAALLESSDPEPVIERAAIALMRGRYPSVIELVAVVLQRSTQMRAPLDERLTTTGAKANARDTSAAAQVNVEFDCSVVFFWNFNVCCVCVFVAF